MTDEDKSTENSTINTDGGTYVEGNVDTGGGDFVGRDKVEGDVVYGDKVVKLRSAQEELSDYLGQAVSAFEARTYQRLIPSAEPPDQPYKFLYAFEIEDADIFFGRDVASQGLHDTVLRDRLTVLHAKSGAGKTSLLNAGLSPRLIREHRLPVYARAYEDPVRAIKRAIASPSQGPWPELLPRLSLHEFLGLVCQHLGRQTQELVIILDQFEEFFVFWPERDHRQPFIDALAECYDDKTLPVRLVVGIRGDYFTHLATFQDDLPHVFHNEYYLDAMSRQEAETAIVGPVSKLGRPVSYERDLLDTLLDDLARGRVELPHLQIICTRLYETLVEGETSISLKAYEAMGHAEGVIGSYLNDVLDRLPGEGADIAKDVLKELVSSESSKRVLSYNRLAERVRTQELDAVLAQLVNARLLHRDEAAGEVTYEMAHECLIGEISRWIGQEDLAFKRVEELLAREVAHCRGHRGTLMPRDRLEEIHRLRGYHERLNDEELQLLVRSSFQAGPEVVRYWLDRLGDPEQQVNVAIEATYSDLAEVRHWAADALNKLVVASPEIATSPAAEALNELLKDEDKETRSRASEALLQISRTTSVALPREAKYLLGSQYVEHWPHEPYPGLRHYELEEMPVFFGREEETQALSLMIHAHRLAVLYGASGVGKTSLLLAGVVPRLEALYEPLFVRSWGQLSWSIGPVDAIRREIQHRLPDVDPYGRMSMMEYLDAATTSLDRTLVIILDQCEGFFGLLTQEARRVFIAELGALYDARDMPVKIVISLREDWLASMDEMDERIPEASRARLHLLPFTKEQASQAMLMPLVRMEVFYEDALQDELLHDLEDADGLVMPYQLQLVCSKLYEELPPDKRLITRSLYERLGRARGVLQGFLSDEPDLLDYDP